MFRDPLLKKRILQTVGLLALVIVLLLAFLGCMLTESLAVMISGLPDAPVRAASVPPLTAVQALAAALPIAALT